MFKNIESFSKNINVAKKNFFGVFFGTLLESFYGIYIWTLLMSNIYIKTKKNDLVKIKYFSLTLQQILMVSKL